MQFSVGCDYAIHGLLFLAMHPEREVVLVTEVARAQNLPESYLAKVFQLLAKAGLVRSFRGARGGYQLAVAPEKITLRDVILAIEGISPLFTPLSSKRECALGDCLIKEAFSKAEKSLYRELEKVTLRQMVERATLSKQSMKWLEKPISREATT